MGAPLLLTPTLLRPTLSTGRAIHTTSPVLSSQSAGARRSISTCFISSMRSAERSSSSPADRRPKSKHTGACTDMYDYKTERQTHGTHRLPFQADPTANTTQHINHASSRRAVSATSSTPPLFVSAGLVEGEGSGLRVNEGILLLVGRLRLAARVAARDSGRVHVAALGIAACRCVGRVGRAPAPATSQQGRLGRMRRR